MDLSIASALWFAARGVGTLALPSLVTSTSTRSKIVTATKSARPGVKPLLRYAAPSPLSPDQALMQAVVDQIIARQNSSMAAQR